MSRNALESIRSRCSGPGFSRCLADQGHRLIDEKPGGLAFAIALDTSVSRIRRVACNACATQRSAVCPTHMPVSGPQQQRARWYDGIQRLPVCLKAGGIQILHDHPPLARCACDAFTNDRSNLGERQLGIGKGAGIERKRARHGVDMAIDEPRQNGRSRHTNDASLLADPFLCRLVVADEGNLAVTYGKRTGLRLRWIHGDHSCIENDDIGDFCRWPLRASERGQRDERAQTNPDDHFVAPSIHAKGHTSRP